jgi:hypothetical protein
MGVLFELPYEAKFCEVFNSHGCLNGEGKAGNLDESSPAFTVHRDRLAPLLFQCRLILLLKRQPKYISQY